MDLTKDGCKVPARWIAAMEKGFRSMGIENAQVIVSANFATKVAEVTGEDTYTTDRGSGQVGARTVPGANGSLVIFNYNELKSRTPSAIQRLAAHEAGHIVINDRKTEEMSGNHDATENIWQWTLKCLGGLAIVEFRIERRLAELGYPVAEWGATAASVDDGLLALNGEVISAAADPASSNDVEHFYTAVLTALSHSTKLLAYVAAPLVEGKSGFSPSQLSPLGQENWDDYIRPSWQRRLDMWQVVPSVNEAISVRTWRSILRKSLLLEKQFLLDVGFAFRDASGGSFGFYREASDSLFETRFLRLQSQVES
jgi:hypothetical protein